MVKAVITDTRICLASEVILTDEKKWIIWEKIIKEFEVSEEIYEKMTDREKYPDYSWSMVGETIKLSHEERVG